MRETMLSVVAVLAIASGAFAQSLPPGVPNPNFNKATAADTFVRTSKVVPDLHNPASGWKVVPEKEQLLYQTKDSTVKIDEGYYDNTKDQMRAYLYVIDAKGNREELAMIYGTYNVAREAIKSGGVWHVSRDLYFDNGKVNPKGDANWTFTYDEKETDKLIKVKLTLETVNGLKEVVINLQ